jgi:hypothetical protein
MVAILTQVGGTQCSFDLHFLYSQECCQMLLLKKNSVLYIVVIEKNRKAEFQ